MAGPSEPISVIVRVNREVIFVLLLSAGEPTEGYQWLTTKTELTKIACCGTS
jgi:hypothetical protein